MAKPKVPTDPKMSPEVRSFLEDLQFQADELQTIQISGVIEAPSAKDFRIIEKIPYPAKIEEFSGKTASGTLTATLKINTTAVTTGELSVTSTQSSATPTALNTMAEDDALVITASAISSPADFSFTVKYRRT